MAVPSDGAHPRGEPMCALEAPRPRHTQLVPLGRGPINGQLLGQRGTFPQLMLVKVVVVGTGKLEGIQPHVVVGRATWPFAHRPRILQAEPYLRRVRQPVHRDRGQQERGLVVAPGTSRQVFPPHRRHLVRSVATYGTSSCQVVRMNLVYPAFLLVLGPTGQRTIHSQKVRGRRGLELQVERMFTLKGRTGHGSRARRRRRLRSR